jgi:hypothetical protein
MAKRILAASSRHRNSILGIAPAKPSCLPNKYPVTDDFVPYSSDELSTLMGLAFTAILVEGREVDHFKSHFNTFIQYRYSLHHSEIADFVVAVMIQILQKGFVSFEALGHPRYFDDFIWAYHMFSHQDSKKNSEENDLTLSILNQIIQDEKMRVDIFKPAAVVLIDKVLNPLLVEVEKIIVQKAAIDGIAKFSDFDEMTRWSIGYLVGEHTLEGAQFSGIAK